MRNRYAMGPLHFNRIVIFLNVLLFYYLTLISAQFTKDFGRNFVHHKTNTHHSLDTPIGKYIPHEPENIASQAKRNRTLSTPAECARECNANEPSKTCYYNFTVELYVVNGGACSLCTPNNTGVVNDCQCVLADGIEKSVIVANRRLPGPSIEVCLGDKVIIDVTNLIPGMEVSIHWHGLYQKETPYFDGVPFLTQCPILRGNTFRYQWFANNPGTHFWHAHTGIQELNGLLGSIIIREPRTHDLHSDLYDYDLSEHVIVLNDWMHDDANEHYPGTVNRNPGQNADAVLINGMGQYTDPDSGNVTDTPLAEFTVSQGYTYRLRIITAFSTSCFGRITVEGHSLIVIATDGEPIEPVEVNSINCFAGERFDVLLKANQTLGAYWIQLRTLGPCSTAQIQQLAILRYDGTSDGPSSDPPTYSVGLSTGVLLNPTDGLCNEVRTDAVCISHLRRAGEIDQGIIQDEPDVKIYLPFAFVTYTPEDIYEPGTYKTYLIPEGGSPLVARVGNFTYRDPSSPPLSQFSDIPSDEFCYNGNLPNSSEVPRACTHVIKIPLGAIVEVVLVDLVGTDGLYHPFHFHGHSYHVMAMGVVNDTAKIDLDRIRYLDENGLLDRNADWPPAKDTTAVPSNGYLIFRFRANNAGWWLMHCHFVYHMSIGMDVVFHVGEQKDLPLVPPKFPTCGNYLPETNYADEWA